MFTLEQVDDIHDRLGAASTLAAYLEGLRGIGVTTSDSYLTDGHTTYYGHDGQRISTPPAHEVLPVAPTGDRSALLHGLELHAEGTISYVEMSRALADAGVEKWTFDTRALTITYYDRTGSPLLSEQIS